MKVVFSSVERGDLMYHHSSSTVPKEEVFDWHHHKQPELLYVVKGRLDCRIGDRIYPMEQGRLYYVAPLVLHRIEAAESTFYERYNILLSKELLPARVDARLSSEGAFCSLPMIAEIRELFRRMDLYCTRFEGEELLSLFHALSLELASLLLLLPSAEREPFEGISPLLRDILHYMEENLTTLRGTEELCRRFFLSKSHLHHLFSVSLGVSPMTYLRRKKLLLAKEALRLGQTAGEVCLSCGFADYSAFFRSYKALFGHAPSEEGTEGACANPHLS